MASEKDPSETELYWIGLSKNVEGNLVMTIPLWFPGTSHTGPRICQALLVDVAANKSQ